MNSHNFLQACRYILYGSKDKFKKKLSAGVAARTVITADKIRK